MDIGPISNDPTSKIPEDDMPPEGSDTEACACNCDHQKPLRRPSWAIWAGLIVPVAFFATVIFLIALSIWRLGLENFTPPFVAGWCTLMSARVFRNAIMEVRDSRV